MAKKHQQSNNQQSNSPRPTDPQHTVIGMGLVVSAALEVAGLASKWRMVRTFLTRGPHLLRVNMETCNILVAEAERNGVSPTDQEALRMCARVCLWAHYNSALFSTTDKDEIRAYREDVVVLSENALVTARAIFYK